MDTNFRNRSPIGGQALPVGVLMRGRRNAVAFRKADGGVEVRSWPAGTKASGSLNKIPVVRGMAQVGNALVQGARTACETVKIAGKAEKKGNPVKKLRMYHGAEHKTIYCYEKGLDMTVENVREQSRVHPRCGTSVAVTALMADAVLTALLPRKFTGNKRDMVETLLLAASIGVSYEVNRLAWDKGNKAAEAITAPGRWAQKFTTAEPDDQMIECAIAAAQAANEQ